MGLRNAVVNIRRCVRLDDVVVGLDLHMKNIQGTILKMNGELVKQEKFRTDKEGLRRFLEGVPESTKVALESVGFCWPWIDYVEELGYRLLLANPVKVKSRAEDVKTDKIDSELLAHLTRMDWLPTSYVPNREMRWLRNLLRHRAFRVKMSTALKNRSWSEFRKRDIGLRADLDTKKGRDLAASFGVFEVAENMEILGVIERQTYLVERMLMKRYAELEPVRLLMTIPGIGFLTALTLYAEICEVRRFMNPEKLAHYCGLVPRVSQSGGHTTMGEEAKANRWLKCILIEAAWSHLRFCPDGRLAKVYVDAVGRKRDKRKAIKIVARKLVNVVWAVWTYEKEFMVME
jgi:transposase